jgi:hypothetical protein
VSCSIYGVDRVNCERSYFVGKEKATFILGRIFSYIRANFTCFQGESRVVPIFADLA